jgi:hypothetical protein
MGMRKCGCGAEMSPSYQDANMVGWFCSSCGSFTPVTAERLTPSCPNCGFTVHYTNSHSSKRWDMEEQQWMPSIFEEPFFTCVHCNLEEHADQLAMRESTG